MRVLITTPDMNYKGGVTNYYQCLMLNEQAGIDYIYVNSFATSPESKFSISRNLLVFKKIINLSLIYLKFLLSLPSYQLVHVNPSLNSKAFFRDAVFIVLSKLMRKKVIVFIHGWEDGFEEKLRKSRLLSLFFKYSYGKADAYIVLGSIFKEKIISLGVDPHKRIYIETTIADSRYIADLDIDEKIQSFEKEVNILFISRILKSKGIYIAMDACSSCSEKVPDRKVTLFVAGDGEELERAKEYVDTNNLHNVEFIGFVKDGMRNDILKKCHIMIFPTYYGEGLPSSIVEGMLYGMPIISRPMGGIPDIVSQGVNGYLSESLDSRVYENYCLQLVENKELYDQMARKNYAKAKKLFVTEAVKERLLGIYNAVLSN